MWLVNNLEIILPCSVFVWSLDVLQGFLQVLQARLGTENASWRVCMMGCCVEQRGGALERLLVFITH